MPSIDGFEFARIMKKQYPKTKIILNPAFMLMKEEFEKNKMGIPADDIIVKPFAISQLQVTISRLLNIRTADARAYITIRILQQLRGSCQMHSTIMTFIPLQFMKIVGWTKEINGDSAPFGTESKPLLTNKSGKFTIKLDKTVRSLDWYACDEDGNTINSKTAKIETRR